jgi:hypothetical protein
LPMWDRYDPRSDDRDRSGWERDLGSRGASSERDRSEDRDPRDVICEHSGQATRASPVWHRQDTVAAAASEVVVFPSMGFRQVIANVVERTRRLIRISDSARRRGHAARRGTPQPHQWTAGDAWLCECKRPRCAQRAAERHLQSRPCSTSAESRDSEGCRQTASTRAATEQEGCQAALNRNVEESQDDPSRVGTVVVRGKRAFRKRDGLAAHCGPPSLADLTRATVDILRLMVE